MPMLSGCDWLEKREWLKSHRFTFYSHFHQNSDQSMEISLEIKNGLNQSECKTPKQTPDDGLLFAYFKIKEEIKQKKNEKTFSY